MFNEIHRIKEEIRAKNAVILNLSKRAREYLVSARTQTDPYAASELRTKADQLFVQASRLGKGQRLLLLQYAWVRNKKYRDIEKRTRHDRMYFNEAHDYRHRLSCHICKGFAGVGVEDILFWINNDKRPSEVLKLRTKQKITNTFLKDFRRIQDLTEDAWKKMEEAVTFMISLPQNEKFDLGASEQDLITAKRVLEVARKTLTETRRKFPFSL